MECFLCQQSLQDLSVLCSLDEIITVQENLNLSLLDIIYLISNTKLEVMGNLTNICKICVNEAIHAFKFKQMCLGAGQRQQELMNAESYNVNILSAKTNDVDTVQTDITINSIPSESEIETTDSNILEPNIISSTTEDFPEILEVAYDEENDTGNLENENSKSDEEEKFDISDIIFFTSSSPDSQENIQDEHDDKSDLSLQIVTTNPEFEKADEEILVVSPQSEIDMELDVTEVTIVTSPISENLPNVKENLELSVENLLPQQSDIDMELDVMETTVVSSPINNHQNNRKVTSEDLSFNLTLKDLIFKNTKDRKPPVKKSKTSRNKVDESRMKSLAYYKSIYNKFQNWRKENNRGYTEEDMLYYFVKVLMFAKTPTLLLTYSILKATLLHHDVNIANYTNLSSFIHKRRIFKGKERIPFTEDQINTFLRKASDSTHLHLKVAVIVIACGNCKRDEMVNLKITDVHDLRTRFCVIIYGQESRSFVIPPKYYKLVKKYVKLRPKDSPTDKFFLTYRDELCVGAALSGKTLTDVPKNTAEWLKLPNAANYNYVCLHRIWQNNNKVQILDRHNLTHKFPHIKIAPES